MNGDKHSRKHKARKRGFNRDEAAVKGRKADRNFRQSRDIREDRGTAQTRHARRKYPRRFR